MASHGSNALKMLVNSWCDQISNRVVDQGMFYLFLLRPQTPVCCMRRSQKFVGHVDKDVGASQPALVTYLLVTCFGVIGE